jgi:hypothetical protein
MNLRWTHIFSSRRPSQLLARTPRLVLLLLRLFFTLLFVIIIIIVVVVIIIVVVIAVRRTQLFPTTPHGSQLLALIRIDAIRHGSLFRFVVVVIIVFLLFFRGGLDFARRKGSSNVRLSS